MCSMAQDLTALQQSGRLGSTPLIGIIKEVEEQVDSKIAADALGVAAFQENFFSYPIYQDAGLEFYKAMGKRKLLSLFSWNPLKWYGLLSKMADRHKGIEGNLKGEGLVLGGVLVVSRENGVVYQYNEVTGDPIPAEEIADAVQRHTP